MKPRVWALARTPWQLRLDELLQKHSDLKGRIAQVELQTAELTRSLGVFEHQLSNALKDEQIQLAASLGLLRTIEREEHVLLAPNASSDERRRMLRRAQQLRHVPPACARLQLSAAPMTAEPTGVEKSAPSAVRQAFLMLAREHHPDLACDEADRSERGRKMAHINHLYRSHQTEALLALALAHEKSEQAPCWPQTQDAHDPKDVLRAQEVRLAELEGVYSGLEGQLKSILHSDTYRLYQALGAEHVETHDFTLLATEIRRDISAHIVSLPRAYKALEELIENVVSNAHQNEYEHAFSPYVHKGLARLSLTHLASARASQKECEDALELVAWAKDQPALMRLVLLTYIAELAPEPLVGLDTFEAIERRLCASSAAHERPVTLAEALVTLKETVALGTRLPEGAMRPYFGLSFIDPKVQKAVPLALRYFDVRHLFRQILLVLGEQRRCQVCVKQVFTIPLFRLRGFDNLRALVCPDCNTQLKSYLLPKGNDIQAVLNLAYLDFDVIEEFVCHLGNTTLAVQLLPDELTITSCQDLVSRIAKDVFARYGVRVDTRYLNLATRNGERLRAHTMLAQLQTRELELLVTTGSVWALDEAIEKVRHRARTQFSTPQGDLNHRHGLHQRPGSGLRSSDP